MASSTNDMLKKTGSNTVTTLSAPGKALGATSINVGSTTNYPTDTGIVIAIRQVDANGDLVPGTYTEYSATVSSATSLAIVATPVLGSDQIYTAGSTTQVYIPLSSHAHNKLVDNILEHANQDGSLITQAVRDALNLDSGSSDGWTPFGYSLTSITALGNRSYTAVVAGVDTTGVTSVGQRLKLPRTVTAPTGSISLNGTTQYANKTSPSGMTFTTSYVASAWIKLSSYNGSDQTIVGRFNGTSGWYVKVNPSGQVQVFGFNSGGGNYRVFTTYQSVPLNKWVHVAAQWDGAASTGNGSSTTNYVLLDGIDIPGSTSTAGTAPTSLIQAGSLEVGSSNGGGIPFGGKIAQVAIYSAKVTQATILASMNQTLTGSETSLVSAYKLDQASGLNDLSANANNLTAQGSPSYASDTPFTNAVTGTSVTAGTTNYGIIMKQEFSTNTTYTIQIPEGETLPTTGGIGTVSYSTQKAPYGFITDAGKWTIQSLNIATATKGSPVNGTWYNGDSTTIKQFSISAPVGAWVIGYEGHLYGNRGVAGVASMYCCLSTTVAAIGDLDLVSRNFHNSVTDAMTTVKREKSITATSATTYYLNHMTDTAGMTTTGIYTSSGQGASVIYARNGYL